MTKPLLSNVHVHITDSLEKCWTCDKDPGRPAWVGGGTFTLRDPDIGIIACPLCSSKEKIV